MSQVGQALNAPLRSAVKPLNINFLSRISGVKYLAPFYHAVSDEPLPHIDPIYRVRNSREFREDLETLAMHYKFVDPTEFKRSIQENQNEKVALLSFDDGLAQCHDVVRPILIEMGIPAVFFINPNFINDKEVFYRYKVGLMISELSKANGFGKTKGLVTHLKSLGKYKGGIKRSLLNLKWEDRILINNYFKSLVINNWERNLYMIDEQVNKMLEEGFFFGGHGMSHRPFYSMTDKERLDDAALSLEYCEKNLGQKLRLFAFPFYDHDLSSTFLQKMHSELKLDMSFGSRGPKTDTVPGNIQRLDMEVNRGRSLPFVKSTLVKQGLRRLISSHTMKRES